MDLANRDASSNHRGAVRHSKTESAPARASAIFQILNDKGLHTRPATELVKITSRFKARAHLTYQGMTVNAKSLLGILMLAAAKGAKISIDAEGPDAEHLIEGVLSLARDKFNILY